ncbi:MAG: hypothetical protein H0U67_10275 [Gemmatimonadetes bacterium]|nr:hypothetical protein [Gemmatimonadota bacterium]
MVIFRTERQGNLQGLRISELLVGPGRASHRTASALLRTILSDAGAEFAAAMAARRTPEQRVLLSAAFLPVPRLGPLLTVRPLGGTNGIDPLQWSHWRPSIGDLELF